MRQYKGPMTQTSHTLTSDHAPDLHTDSLNAFRSVRARTRALANGLSDADATAQSMDDASPLKWHLAHTSWFFEEFILCGHLGQTERFDPRYAYLFNSYYNAVGERHDRPNRGLLTRPSLDDILGYRTDVDDRMSRAIPRLDERGLSLLELGLAHEEQHQELALTDILHLFAQSPLRPAFSPGPSSLDTGAALSLAWISFDGGMATIGHDGDGFAFDCEGPSHDVVLQPFALANRAVTNAEWIAFMEDGGYSDAAYWLSDGWDWAQAHEITSPLYWNQVDRVWHSMTLDGHLPLDPAAPVTHISFFEADAFASWAATQWSGARLPTEFEWEHAARSSTASADTPPAPDILRPHRQVPSQSRGETPGLEGLFSDVWEWTSSAFLPYPRFKPGAGAIGEYNGKFMNGQRVLRGASCVTSPGHSRVSYRNFFYPEKRWQFTGLRLARDV